MPRVAANGIELEYALSGPEDGHKLLCIHGLGAQLIQWPAQLCDVLATAGFRVIRFDNRDVGLSTHFDGVPVPDIHAVIATRRRGERPMLPYTVADMAADAIGLLDALGIERVDVLGASLGGLIAQTLAITRPERVRSLNLMMTHAGNPELPPSQPRALAALATPAPDPATDAAGFAERALMLGRVIGSPLYPIDDAIARAFFLDAARRSHDPQGTGRQFAASRGCPDLRPGLRNLSIPTLVIHGSEDPIFPPEGGREIADCVSGAYYLEIGGMGHDLPQQLFESFVSAIAMNARRAR